MQETWVWSPGPEDHLEKKIVTHSSALAWEVPCTEEPGRSRFMGSQKSGTWLSGLTTRTNSAHEKGTRSRSKKERGGRRRSPESWPRPCETASESPSHSHVWGWGETHEGRNIVEWRKSAPCFKAVVLQARTWTQPRCPLTDEWIKKLWYIHTVEYHSAVKRNTSESVLMF